MGYGLPSLLLDSRWNTQQNFIFFLRFVCGRAPLPFVDSQRPGFCQHRSVERHSSAALVPGASWARPAPAGRLCSLFLVTIFSPTAKLAMGSLAQKSSGAIRCSCNTRFRRRFRRVPEPSGADC